MTTTPTFCLWWDHACGKVQGGRPFFWVRAPVPVEHVLHNIGKHLALGLYTLAPTFNATQSTVTVMCDSSTGPVPLEFMPSVFKSAVHPDFASVCSPDERAKFVEYGLLEVDPADPDRLIKAPFPLIHRHLPPPIDHPPTGGDPASPGGETASASSDSPGSSVGLTLLAMPRAGEPGPPQWSGARVGAKYDFGPASTPSLIVAEFGRQLGPGLGLYKVLSAVATRDEIQFIVELCEPPGEERESRAEVAFLLLKGGGVPWSQYVKVKAVEAGLLPPDDNGSD